MKKDAYYFPHDCTARNDVKILKLRRIYGAKGYGIFWMLIEVLRETTDYKLPISAIEELAFDFREPKEIIASVINDFELFEINNNYFFFSKSLIDRMAPLEARKKALSEAGKKGRLKQLQASNNNKSTATPGHKKRIDKNREYYNYQLNESLGDELYKTFVNYILGDNDLKKEYKSILNLEDQLSYQQFLKIHKKSIDLGIRILPLIDSLENNNQYTKGKKSLYLILNTWLNNGAKNKKA